MKYIFKQKIIEYTEIETENEEMAWEIFNSGDVSHKECDYEDAEMTEEAA